METPCEIKETGDNLVAQISLSFPTEVNAVAFYQILNLFCFHSIILILIITTLVL